MLPIATERCKRGEKIVHENFHFFYCKINRMGIEVDEEKSMCSASIRLSSKCFTFVTESN